MRQQLLFPLLLLLLLPSAAFLVFSQTLCAIHQNT
jgi:hypothetical protein